MISFRAVDLREVDKLGDAQHTHWYYVSKSRALLRAIGDRPPVRILDVGAGTGYFAKVLLRHTDARSAVCVDTGYRSVSLESCSGKPLAFTPSVASPGEADLILMMDVLEHVDDDEGLVRTYAETAPPGARFVVSVPAFDWLWSPHDDFLDHRRRYTPGRLRSVLLAAGLTSSREFFFFGSVFPAALAQRIWSRRPWAPPASPRSMLKRHHPLTNALLTRICTAESAIATHNHLFGLTGFAVAEKTR